MNLTEQTAIELVKELRRNTEITALAVLLKNALNCDAVCGRLATVYVQVMWLSKHIRTGEPFKWGQHATTCDHCATREVDRMKAIECERSEFLESECKDTPWALRARRLEELLTGERPVPPSL